MSPELAMVLVQRLVAAFPSPRWGDDTVEFYAAELEPYDFEVADTAIAQIARTHIARPSVAVMRQEVAKRVPERPALEGPAADDWLPSHSAGLARRLHPGQGETPTHVVRTTSEERRRYEAIYRAGKQAYSQYLAATTPEQRRKDSLAAHHAWRARREQARGA
jgi:hypothetical protein